MSMTEMAYRLQLCDESQDITAQPYAMDDATEIRAWDGAHGDICILSATRDERTDTWIDLQSDLCWEFPDILSEYTLFKDVLHIAAVRNGVHLTEAVCRCGMPGDECD